MNNNLPVVIKSVPSNCLFYGDILCAYLFLLAEWSEQEVVDKYLKPIGMEHLAKAFVENKITGSVLLNLEVQK